jgi:hypothetical protein
MDEDKCSTCGAEYVVFRDLTNRLHRYLCRCELDRKCALGRHPASHVRLTAGGEVDKFLCDDHGVPADERPVAPVLPPEPVKPFVPTPVVERKKKVKEDVKKVKHDLLTLEGFKASLAEDKLRGRCKKCKRERFLTDSVFKQVVETPLFNLFCPHCGHDRHDFL